MGTIACCKGPAACPRAIGVDTARTQGVALVLALVFVVLLAAIVTEFAYEMQVDASLIERHTSDTEAYMAAKSSIALSMSVLAADLFGGEEEAQQTSSAVYDSLDEPWAASAPLIPMNDAMVAIQIDDEYGKINLNALIYEDEGARETEFMPLIDALMVLFDRRMVEDLPVDAILDWLDSDDDTRPLGAENDYYQNLETPFECKNGPMDSIEELLLLPGITPEVFFGDGELAQAPLAELLTVHGHPEGKVNVNTAPYEVLESMFTADGLNPAPEEKANEVLQRIQDEGPYVSLEALRAAGILPQPPRDQGVQNGPSPPPSVPDLYDIASEVFRIQGDGQSGDAQVRIEAYVWRDTHGSGAAQLFRVIDWRVIR